jgi:hypothetical protein
MESLVINSRRDLDALAGTPDYAAFMAMLGQSIYRMERDDPNQTWVAAPDTSTIQRFGFTLADFPDAQPPALPVWEPIDSNVKTISKLQFVEWCEANNKLADLQALLGSNDIIKLKWDAATSLEITNQLVLDAAQAMSLDAQAVFNEIGNQL